MEDRAISLNAVLDIVSDMRGLCRRDVLQDTLKQLQQLPPVTPQPKTGHWVDNNNGTISCSYCHTWFNKDDRHSYMNYCPYCNAMMVEPQESEVNNG